MPERERLLMSGMRRAPAHWCLGWFAALALTVASGCCGCPDDVRDSLPRLREEWDAYRAVSAAVAGLSAEEAAAREELERGITLHLDGLVARTR